MLLNSPIKIAFRGVAKSYPSKHATQTATLALDRLDV